MRHVLQQRFVLFAQRYPVIAVHVGHIEPIAIAPPDFVENLGPLFSRHAIDHKSGCGNRFAGFVSLWRCIIKTKGRAVPHQDLCAVARHCITINVVRDRCLFPILKSKDAQLGRTITLTPIVESRTYEVQQMARLRGQAAIVVRAQWNASDARRDAGKINHQIGGRLWRACRLHFRRGLWLISRLAFGRFRLLIANAYFITLGRERMFDVFAQSHRIDVRVAIRRIVEFKGRNLGREFAVADEVEIVPLRIPNRIERVEHLVSDALKFVFGGAPNVNLGKAVAACGHAESEKVAPR